MNEYPEMNQYDPGTMVIVYSKNDMYYKGKVSKYDTGSIVLDPGYILKKGYDALEVTLYNEDQSGRRDRIPNAEEERLNELGTKITINVTDISSIAELRRRNRPTLEEQTNTN